MRQGWRPRMGMADNLMHKSYEEMKRNAEIINKK